MSGDLSQNATISAIAGAISGGLISFIVAKLTETGIARKRLVDALDDAVEETVVVASAYWRTGGQDVAEERRIKSLFDRIDVKLRAIQDFDHQVDTIMDLTAPFDRLEEVVTGGLFESARRRRDVARIASLKDAARDISFMLRRRRAWSARLRDAIP